MSDNLLEAVAVLLGTTPDKVEVTKMTIGPDTKFTPGPRYLEWLIKASKLVNKDIEEMKEDECWYWCYDDGLSPESAAAAYLKSFGK